MRSFAILVFGAFALAAMQKYTGPRPPKADVPYLLHADNLVATEVAEAKEQPRKDDILYIVAGAGSPVKTPLASPILLLQAEKLDPGQLQLYKLDSRNGQREILFRKKKNNNPRPIRLETTRLGSDNLYRIEVDESLENGEYSLTPEGSNQVFCFAVE
jgi:hypothetical protein